MIKLQFLGKTVIKPLNFNSKHILHKAIIAITQYHMCEKMAQKMFGLYLVKNRGTKNPVCQHFGLMAIEEGTVIEREKDK